MDFKEEFSKVEGISLAKLILNPHQIYVAKKTVTKVRAHIPFSQLKKISKSKQTAVDKCMLFISYLSPSFYTPSKNGWRRLNSSILRANLNNYTAVIEVLEEAGVIEVNHKFKYSKDRTGFSKNYRLTPKYFKKGKLGLNPYTIKSKQMRTNVTTVHDRQLKKALDNDIARNLIVSYADVKLPTKEEITARAKQLSGTIHKKSGKKYKRLGKHSKNEYDHSKFKFLEDDIKLYERLTSNGFLIPIVTTKRSGERVVDSFNLMPSWIRELVKMDDEETVEVDATCLHPNITTKLYGGKDQFITHDKVAKYLGIERHTAKIEHLSFFNKQIWQMKKSPLWEYYNKNDKEMLSNITKEKALEGYKKTSERLFTQEVKVFSQAIKELNSQNIFPLYIFDAMKCKKSEEKQVREAINRALKTNKIYTTTT